jgi:hypothetical protein
MKPLNQQPPAGEILLTPEQTRGCHGLLVNDEQIKCLPSAKRNIYTRFHPETGYIQYPVNPVNPVYSKIKIESIHHFTLTKIFGYNS